MKNDIRAFFALTKTGVIELVRSRVYIALFVAGVALVFSAVIFEELAAGEGGRMIADIGGGFVTLLVSILGIITAITSLSRDVDTKRLYHVIFRPFSKGVVPLACFASSAVLIAFSCLILGGLLWFLGWFGEWPGPERAFALVAIGALEGLVVCAVAVLFASISSSSVAAVNATLVFLLGRLSQPLEEVAQRDGVGALSVVLKGALHVIPRLDRFDASSWTSYDVLGATIAYAGVYLTGVLLAATVLFSRREL